MKVISVQIDFLSDASTSDTDSNCCFWSTWYILGPLQRGCSILSLTFMTSLKSYRYYSFDYGIYFLELSSYYMCMASLPAVL